MHTLLDERDKTALKEKPFLVIPISREVIMDITGSAGICDNCYDEPELGIYIAVLGHWDCIKCFKEWLHRSTYYPQDRKIEEKKYLMMLKALGRASILN